MSCWSDASRHPPRNAPLVFQRKLLCTVALSGAAVATTSLVGCDTGNTEPTGIDKVALGRVDGKDRAMLLMDLLQSYFVHRLANISKEYDDPTVEYPEKAFKVVNWLRNEGINGGGSRFQVENSAMFNRASVNVSSMDYHDRPQYPIKAVNALSVILHPRNPYAPSIHFHLCYMETRHGSPYWRMIADLNPSIPRHEDTLMFKDSLRPVFDKYPQMFEDAMDFGKHYFYIPTMDRTRGVAHLFVAKLSDDEVSTDSATNLAATLAETVIDTYTQIVEDALRRNPINSITKDARDAQIAYHTLYLFQVITLDRGTTYGLLAHNQNDIGTLGSIPTVVDRSLLERWVAHVELPPLTSILLRNVVNALPSNVESDSSLCNITDEIRQVLANTVRNHFKDNPEAVALQAAMDMQSWEKRQKTYKART